MQTPIATIERGTTHWLARILEPGKEPQYFVPDPQAYIVTKGDLVRAVNKACPGVTYVSEETFNASVLDETIQHLQIAARNLTGISDYMAYLARTMIEELQVQASRKQEEA